MVPTDPRLAQCLSERGKGFRSLERLLALLDRDRDIDTLVPCEFLCEWVLKGRNQRA